MRILVGVLAGIIILIAAAVLALFTPGWVALVGVVALIVVAVFTVRAVPARGRR